MEFFMRMKLILGVMVLGFTACSNKKTVDPNPVVRDNIIHLSTAIKNVREEMMLSELVDSVSYIPLETNPNCMLGNYQRLTFSPNTYFTQTIVLIGMGSSCSVLGARGKGLVKISMRMWLI